MNFFNKYCIMGFVLLAIAGLWFPGGIVIDVGIIVAYVYLKNKAGAKKDKQDNKDTAGTTDDMFKLLALSMISGNANRANTDEPSKPTKSGEQKDKYSLEYRKKFLY